jgi:hypothetical protein
MNLKWAFGTVVAVLTAMLVLPGIASAHHPDLNGSVDCSDGSFNVTATYTGGNSSRNIEMILSDGGGDDQFHGPTNDWAPLEIEYHEDIVVPGPDFEFDDSQDRFEADAGYTGPFDFFEVNGTYYDLASFVENDIDIYADINTGTDAHIEVRQTDSEDIDFDGCIKDYCVDGSNGVDQLEFESTATNDCDPVRICLASGESITLTEYQANQLTEEFTPGSCTPSEPPPPNVPGPEEEPEEPVEEVQEAVAEVSPAVEEVAALPAAGQSDIGGVSYTWVAIFGLAVIGFGGATLVSARQRK